MTGWKWRWPPGRTGCISVRAMATRRLHGRGPESGSGVVDRDGRAMRRAPGGGGLCWRGASAGDGEQGRSRGACRVRRAGRDCRAVRRARGGDWRSRVRGRGGGEAAGAVGVAVVSARSCEARPGGGDPGDSGGMEPRVIPEILTSAGSDPSGGAGIQADIKAISARGGYAMAAITGLTAQNTRGVQAVELVSPRMVAAPNRLPFAPISGLTR